MLLAYVDESYDAGHYWIAAVVCPEAVVVPLTEALDAVVAKASRSYTGIGLNAELHGHALFHGKEDWVPVATMPRVRIGVYNEAFEVIGAHDVRIIIRGVDIARLKARYVYPDHPHSVVLAHLLERVDEHAERQNELVIVIADEVDDAAEHRRNLWFFQRYATSGYRARQLTRIVDTIHFAPSKSSRLLQAADLVAYLHFRRRSGVETDARAVRANDALWDRISQRIGHLNCWTP